MRDAMPIPIWSQAAKSMKQLHNYVNESCNAHPNLVTICKVSETVIQMRDAMLIPIWSMKQTNNCSNYGGAAIISQSGHKLKSEYKLHNYSN